MAENTRRPRTFLWIFLGVVAVVLLFGLVSIISVSRVITEFNNGDSGYGSNFSFGSGQSIDDEIVILEVDGVIFGSKDILKEIKRLEKSDSLRAVLLRINSPGGAVAPTQEIHQALMKLKEKVNIYCSFGDVAASGGYYLATVCEKIFSNPGTLTGSIGVIMQTMNMSRLYEWAKLDPVTIKAGKFKDAGSPARAMKPEEKALFQEMIDSIHGQFKSAVREGRPEIKLTQENLEKYTDGRVFTGAQGQEYGFIDELGGENWALRDLAEKVEIKVPDNIKRLPRKKKEIAAWFESKLPKNEATAYLTQMFQSLSPSLNPKIKAGHFYFLPYNYLEGIRE